MPRLSRHASRKRRVRWRTPPKISPNEPCGSMPIRATIAEALPKREVLDKSEITTLIGPSVNESHERSVSIGPAQVASV